MGFLRGSVVKNLPAVQVTQVQPLDWEDLLEEDMATHSSILPGKSHGQRSLLGYSPWGCKESDMTEQLSMHVPMRDTSFSINLPSFGSIQ